MGKRAFEGKSQISVASAILEKDPEPISATKPLTPAAFDHLVAACLAKDREERFQSGITDQMHVRCPTPIGAFPTYRENFPESVFEAVERDVG